MPVKYASVAALKFTIHPLISSWFCPLCERVKMKSSPAVTAVRIMSPSPLTFQVNATLFSAGFDCFGSPVIHFTSPPVTYPILPVVLSGETIDSILPSGPDNVISGNLLLRWRETFVSDPPEHDVIRLRPEIRTSPQNSFVLSIVLLSDFY